MERSLSKSAENKKTYLYGLQTTASWFFFCWRVVSPLLEKRIRNHRKQFRKCDQNIVGPRILRTEVLLLHVLNRWLPRERRDFRKLTLNWFWARSRRKKNPSQSVYQFANRNQLWRIATDIETLVGLGVEWTLSPNPTLPPPPRYEMERKSGGKFAREKTRLFDVSM